MTQYQMMRFAFLVGQGMTAKEIADDAMFAHCTEGQLSAIWIKTGLPRIDRKRVKVEFGDFLSMRLVEQAAEEGVSCGHLVNDLIANVLGQGK